MASGAELLQVYKVSIHMYNLNSVLVRGVLTPVLALYLVDKPLLMIHFFQHCPNRWVNVPSNEIQSKFPYRSQFVDLQIKDKKS